MKPVAQLRRENLARLVDKYTQVGIAAKIGKDRNQIYQWLLEPGAKGARGMGGPSARIIEAAYGLPAGWLDHEHSSEPLPESQSQIPDPAILLDAEYLVLMKERALSTRFLETERARQLAQAYGLVLTHGATLDQSIIDGFVGSAKSEREGVDEGERSRKSGRG
jgi:hypothetical protein